MHPKLILSLLVVFVIVAGAFLIVWFLSSGKFPSWSHLWSLGIVYSIFRYLLSFVGVYFTYLIARAAISALRPPESLWSEVRLYLIAIGISCFMGLSAAYYLGTHQEDVDPYFGDGDVVVDYEATLDQKLREGLIRFFCLCVPALFGVTEGIAVSKRTPKNSINNTQN